jgi:hypothetical protein
MEKGTEVLSTSFLNLDFIYYLIYLFFKSIKDFFVVGSEDGAINFFNVWRHVTDGSVVLDSQRYSEYGEGVGALYDGYSLVTPPHGATEFGGFIPWIENFFTNPYCSECASFLDLFFGGLNSWLYLGTLIGFVLLLFLKQKNEFLEEKEEVLYDRVYQKDVVKNGSKKNQKWENIIALVASENPNDWKVAVMDADNLLEEALEENKFYGDTIGERLKKGDFKTIQSAWDGHRVRNQIAHDTSYELTKREAKSAITSFGKVFGEFYH